MIDFDRLEREQDALHRDFTTATPFSHVVLDNFCDPDALRALVSEMPNPDDGNVQLSRDYIFAKKKFEKSDIAQFGPYSQQMYNELMSDRFKSWLRILTGDPVFVDPKFHGGGFHQGGEGSFLDMHADFNYHPLNTEWFRNLNILIYLNENWQPSFGGSLKLRHIESGEKTEVPPLFNRCVIMHTREYTLHGYDQISFPKGQYRRSIAAYAYDIDVERGQGPVRSTTWFPEQGGAMKQLIGKTWPTLVRIKTSVFGSGTNKNQ